MVCLIPRGGTASQPHASITDQGRRRGGGVGRGDHHQGGVLGQAQGFRNGVPGEITLDFMFPRGGLDNGSAIPFQHHHRGAVEGDVAGPVATVPGQDQPGFGVHQPALVEAPGPGAQFQGQLRGPGAAVGAGLIVDQGAAPFRVILQNPIQPGLQRFRNLMGFKGRGGWGRQQP